MFGCWRHCGWTCTYRRHLGRGAEVGMEENTALLWVTIESLAWALGITGLERKETRKGVPAREVAALPGSWING